MPRVQAAPDPHGADTLLPRGLSVKDAAAYGGVSVRDLWRRVERGELPVVRWPGCRRVVFDRRDLDALFREVAPMRFRAEDLRPHGWTPPQTLQVPDWCGCTTEYLPVLVGNGWWQMVRIWEPGQPVNPLRRYEPAEPR